MQLLTKLVIKIKNGFLPHLINEIYKRKCSTRNITLIKNESGFDLFDIEVVYSNYEKFSIFINTIGKYEENFQIVSSESFLEKEIIGGMLSVSGKLQFDNLIDYEMNVLGAAELAIKKASDEENIFKYSGISKNIGIFCGISFLNDSEENHLRQQFYCLLERDSIIINKFTGLNAFPILIKINQLDDFIKILQGIENTFSAIRIFLLNDVDDIQSYERIYNDISLPVLSYYYDEIPLYLLISISHLLIKNNINIKDCNVGLIGINITSLRMVRLLVKLGFPRVLGCDNNIKLMHGFEREGGLATIFDNIANNCDIIIIIKDQLNTDDLHKFSSGQIVISLLNKELESGIMKERGVLEFLQSGWMDLSAFFPGILKGLIECNIKYLDDDKLLKLMNKIISLKLKDEILPNVFSEVNQRLPQLISEL
jgi:malate dehydrogenase (oxaloacetate-decarboxylating)